MLKKAGVIGLAAGVLLAAGCSPKATPTVNSSMTKVMQPQAQVIWDITSRAFNEKGDGLDGAKISDADWIRLAQASRRVRDRARILAEAPHVTAATPGEPVMGGYASHTGVKQTWDAASAAQIQGLIDANPAGFSQHARALADSMNTLLNAAHARDAVKVYAVSSDLDEKCDGCHQPFWGTDDPPPFPH
jgi:hypothetical protein